MKIINAFCIEALAFGFLLASNVVNCCKVNTECVSAICSAAFNRCDCPAEAVLSTNGLCKVASKPLPECSAAYTASFNLAVMASPEVSGKDVSSGVPSAKLVTILRLSTAAALQQNVSDVSITNISLKLMAGDLAGLSGARSSILQFDMAFNLCSKDNSTLTARSFEFGFIAGVSGFAGFQMSAVKLLDLIDLNPRSSTLAPSPAPLPFGLKAGADSTIAKNDSTGAIVGFVVGSLAVVIFISAAVLGFVWHRRRHRLKVLHSEDEFHQEGLSQTGQESDVQRVLAHVSCSFSPADVEDNKVFRETCLELQIGDIVEVIAGGGGWFYGRIISQADESTEPSERIVRVGYFPENRVSWIGKIPGSCDTKVSNPEQHSIVAVELGFSPADVEDTGSLRENCLEISAGEIVEVLASGGGWLYGHVAGKPELAGYFPENRATWLGHCDSGGDATMTEQGRLVQVVRNFSPGIPGDSEEEVSFSDSCIALAEGDVVEVAAAAGGWLYGRVVGSPDRIGYFPETRISWLGRAVPETILAISDDCVLVEQQQSDATATTRAGSDEQLESTNIESKERISLRDTAQSES